jgi:hypothetical protein
MKNIDEEYKYQYPSNLGAKPMFLFWTGRDTVIIVFAGLISAYFLFSLGTPVPTAATVCYVILTMQISGDSRNLAQYIQGVFTYIGNPIEWIYRPENNSETFESSQQHVSRRQKKNAHEKQQKTVINREAKKHQKDNERAKVLQEKNKQKLAKKEQRRKMAELNKLDKKEKSSFSLKNLLLKNAIAVLFLIVIVVLLGYIFLRGKVVNDSSTAQIDLNYTKSTDIEWYSGSVDPLTFIDYDSSTQGITVTANPETIDSTKLGTTEVTYTITDSEGNKKEITREYNIVDNELPIITLKSDYVEVAVGSEFDPASNIDSVVDRIDGALNKVDESSFGGYTITSNVDTNIAGDYKVQISAIDSNGNEATSSYDVAVK